MSSAWSSHKRAGFALAALLADDRELTQVRGRLPDPELTALRAQLDRAAQPSRSLLIAELISAVRPPLGRASLSLPLSLVLLLAPYLPRGLLRRRLRDAPPDALGRVQPEELRLRMLRLARTLEGRSEQP